MKEFNLVILEKIQLQLLWISILLALFGVSSMWEFQSDMFQQIQVRKNVLSDPGETRVEENWRS